MNHSRLVWTALALWAVAGTTTIALACSDKAKGASAASAACTAEMAAKCTPAQAAACKSMGAATAVTASIGTAAGAAGCPNAAATAITASASRTASLDGCPHAATAAARKPATVTAVTAGAGASCYGEGVAKVADRSAHLDCDACGDMAKCEQEISAAGGRAQVIPLKNGVMFLYTADASSGVHAVQAAVARRSERMMAMSATADRAHLCSECKAMRGAAASGKLTREVVNIEGGCLTLMTSNDPAIVARIHAMAGIPMAARTKS